MLKHRRRHGGNYIWAHISSTTTPSLSDLTGTPFGGRGSPPPVPVLEYNIFGLAALIGILSVALAVATMKKRKSK